MRRLVTHLVYQFPCFGHGDAERLREILQKNTRIYFKEIEHGFDALYRRSVRELIGSDYDRLHSRLDEAGRYRNKIFHGQLTSEYLSRQELVGYICDIRSWCKALADSSAKDFHYDGFGRNSFQKSPISNLHDGFKIQMTGLDDYRKFVRDHMERPQRSHCECHPK